MSTEPKTKKRRRMPASLDGRVVSALVFGASVLALGLLEVARSPDVTVPAVAWAPSIDHPAPAETTVATVHVRPGESVESGSALVTLEGHNLRNELRQLDLAILVAIEESQVAQAELTHESSRLSIESQTRLREALRDTQVLRSELEGHEVVLSAAQQEAARLSELAESQLAPRETAADASRRLLAARLDHDRTATRLRAELGRLRVMRNSGESAAEELVRTTARLHETKLELLQAQREELAARIERLEVRATRGGVVANVLDEGASVARGTSVARLVPRQASEVIAYLPPETNPGQALGGSRVLIAQTGGSACAGTLTRRVGGQVEQVPGESTPFGAPAFGLPVYISVPPECALGVGQRVWVSLQTQ